MGFMDKAKAAAEQAATKAREGVDDVQTKRSLAHAYEQLGRTAHELAESGELAHDRLVGHLQEIRELKSQGSAEPAAASVASDGADSP